MILLKNVPKSYGNGVHTLRDINSETDEGEFVYIIGPTGCGKSTLIKLLNGEELPDTEEVYVAETNMGKLRHSRVPFYRRNISVVLQDSRLFPKMTVFENIAFALGALALDKVMIRRRVCEILELVLLQDKTKSFPDQLSGGQQRATIARAITNHPKVLIADELTGDLDPKKLMEIIEPLDKINKVEGTTIVIVTRDSTFVNTYKKRAIVLEDGFIVADTAKGGYIHYNQFYTKSPRAFHDGAL